MLTKTGIKTVLRWLRWPATGVAALICVQNIAGMMTLGPGDAAKGLVYGMNVGIWGSMVMLSVTWGIADWYKRLPDRAPEAPAAAGNGDSVETPDGTRCTGHLSGGCDGCDYNTDQWYEDPCYNCCRNPHAPRVGCHYEIGGKRP